MHIRYTYIKERRKHKVLRTLEINVVYVTECFLQSMTFGDECERNVKHLWQKGCDGLMQDLRND